MFQVIMPYYQSKEDDRELFYDIKGEGEPIVFIHGYLGSSKTHWPSQIGDPELTNRFTVITPDLRGFGLSGMKKYGERHKTEILVNDIKFLISDHLKLGKIHFVGYSITAAFIIAYALKYPDQVKTLTLLSPNPFLGKTARSYPFLSKGRRSKSKKSSLLWGIVKIGVKRYTYLSLRWKLFQSKKYLNTLKKMRTPTMMIFGTKDSVTPKIAYDTVKKFILNLKTIEVPYDHGIAHEHATEFNNYLLEFIQENS